MKKGAIKISPEDSAKRHARLLELLLEPGGALRNRHDLGTQVQTELGIPCPVYAVRKAVKASGIPDGRNARKGIPLGPRTTPRAKPRPKPPKQEKPEKLEVISKSTFQGDVERVLRHMQARGLSEVRISADGCVEVTKTECEKFRL